MADERPRRHIDEARARSLVDVGAELAGAIGGTGASLVVGEFGGAAIGVAITRGAKAVAGRLLRREEVRIGATLGLIGEDAEERRQRGEMPRDDGFFDERGGLRAEADDLLEGILREAAAAYEERKVALLGRLFSETAHSSAVEPSQAVFMLRLVRELTYRQLVILSAFAVHDPRHVQKVARASDRAALDDLGERGLLAIETNGELRAPGRLGERMTWADFQSFPTRLSDAQEGVKLTPLGKRLVRLTDAGETIPATERAAWFRRGTGDDPAPT
jgi:hypothetical protein